MIQANILVAKRLTAKMHNQRDRTTIKAACENLGVSVFDADLNAIWKQAFTRQMLEDTVSLLLTLYEKYPPLRNRIIAALNLTEEEL